MAGHRKFGQKGATFGPPSTAIRPCNMALRETRSNAPRPSTDTIVARSSMSVTAGRMCATHSQPPLVFSAYWKAIVLAISRSHHYASDSSTRLLQCGHSAQTNGGSTRTGTSPLAMMPPRRQSRSMSFMLSIIGRKCSVVIPPAAPRLALRMFLMKRSASNRNGATGSNVDNSLGRGSRGKGGLVQDLSEASVRNVPGATASPSKACRAAESSPIILTSTAPGNH